VGRVTKPGLEQPVGAPAINRVPREMITQEVMGICEALNYTGGIRITVSVPEGEAIAKKTFNPHIGILGGISILGTSGIVVPMSEEALIASIRLEMKQKYANGERYLLITPGNYGADFIRRQDLFASIDVEHSMKCSNYVGETVDMAVELGFQGILFIAHIGKFIKVSGGIMNTHSAHADCRAELMAAQTLRAGLAQQSVDLQTVQETVRRLLETNTTEEAVVILREAGLLEAAMEEITKRIRFHLQKRCRGEIQTEVILYSNQSGYLGESDGAEELLQIVAEQ
jgi:cobalt-precorrin-5B (C1)-methyltransferase